MIYYNKNTKTGYINNGENYLVMEIDLNGDNFFGNYNTKKYLNIIDDDDDIIITDKNYGKIPIDKNGSFDTEILKKKYDEIFTKYYDNIITMKEFFNVYCIYGFYIGNSFMYSLNKPYYNKHKQFCFNPIEYDNDCEFVF